jgi:hypothetical protein
MGTIPLDFQAPATDGNEPAPGHHLVHLVCCVVRGFVLARYAGPETEERGIYLVATRKLVEALTKLPQVANIKVEQYGKRSWRIKIRKRSYES